MSSVAYTVLICSFYESTCRVKRPKRQDTTMTKQNNKVICEVSSITEEASLLVFNFTDLNNHSIS